MKIPAPALRALRIVLVALGILFAAGLFKLERWVSFCLAVVAVFVILVTVQRHAAFTLKRRVVAVIALLVLIRIALQFGL